MVDPYITAVAAEAAISSLCEENSWPREIFDADDDDGDSIVDGVPNSIADSETNGYIYIVDILHFHFNEVILLKFSNVWMRFRGDEVEGSVIEGGAAPSGLCFKDLIMQNTRYSKCDRGTLVIHK